MSSKHKYIFFVYPGINEKHGRFIFVRRTKELKTKLKQQNLKYDFKKLF